MIFLPLMVAATVLSGVVLDDEQATPKTAMAVTITHKKEVEILFTSLLLKHAKRPPAFSLESITLDSSISNQAAFAILPPLMHFAHTRIRRALPFGSCTRTC